MAGSAMSGPGLPTKAEEQHTIPTVMLGMSERRRQGVGSQEKGMTRGHMDTINRFDYAFLGSEGGPDVSSTAHTS